MSNANFKDHFSGHSTAYAAFRPTYPRALATELKNISPGRQLALDVACGSGQLTVLLAEQFDRVVGTDASAAQIAASQPHERVTYKVALAEESGLPESCVDLVTVAQAAHWLNLDAFYREVRRVARPGAVVALICYGLHRIDDAIDRVVERFYSETVGRYWPPERRFIEERYRSVPFPFDDIRLPELSMEADWRLDDLLNYLSTWSAVQAARRATGVDPIAPLAEELRQVWGDEEMKRRITWPLTVRAGRSGFPA